MNYWMIIWNVFLSVALMLFGLMAVLVTIGGARDIRTMFQRLAESDAKEPDEE